jgi:hypothetical protein
MKQLKRVIQTTTDTGVKIKITVFANEPRVFIEGKKFKGWGVWGKLPNAEGFRILNGNDSIGFAVLSQKIKCQIENIKIELIQKQHEFENLKTALINNHLIGLIQIDEKGKAFRYPKYLKILNINISNIKNSPFIRKIKERKQTLVRMNDEDLERISILSVEERKEILKMLKDKG